jgi:tetratricopeptide (TPR) repeat protein
MSESRRRIRLVFPVIGLLAGACPACSREDPRDLVFRAEAELDAGRPAEAEAALARLARIRRLSVSERLMRSKAASDRGRIDEALAALDDAHAPTKGPDAALIAARRGELEMERHRFRAAEAELKRAVVLDPRSVDPRRRLVWLFAQQGRFAEVAAESRAIAAAGMMGFTELVVWTLARHAPLDLDDLAGELGRAVDADPGDRMSRLALAETLRQLGRLDEAASTLAAVAPNDREARACRARIALDRGDSAAAEALLKTDSGADGDDPAASELRGRLALARGKSKSAAREFRAALRAAPDDRDAHFGLSQALRLLGEVEAARPHAESARARDRLEWLVQIARSPSQRNDPAALQAVAAACAALGRRDEARAWYRLALLYAPDDPGLRKALAELD